MKVRVDGIMLGLPAGEVVRLRPGQSLCIPPRTIHPFWGEEGTGITISSEVSCVCDDWNDNFSWTRPSDSQKLSKTNLGVIISAMSIPPQP